MCGITIYAGLSEHEHRNLWQGHRQRRIAKPAPVSLQGLP